MTLKETLAHFKGVDTNRDVLNLTFNDDDDQFERQAQVWQQLQRYIRQSSSQSEIPKRLAAVLYALLDHHIVTEENFAEMSQHYGNILISQYLDANPDAVKDKALEEAEELEIKEETARRQSIRETNQIIDVLTQAENTSLFHQNEGELVWINLQKFTDEELLRFHLELVRRENKLNSNIQVVLNSAQWIENTYRTLGKKLVDVIKTQQLRKMEYLSNGLMPGGKPLTLNLLRLSGNMDKFHLLHLRLNECRNIMALDFGRLSASAKDVSTLLQKVASSPILETLRSIDLSKLDLTKVAPQSMK